MKSRSLLVSRFVKAFGVFVLSMGLSACAASQPASPDQSPNTADGPAISVAVIGPNAEGDDCYYAEPTRYSLSDHDAWSATQACFDAAGLTYDASNSDYGVMLTSITSPYTGDTLAWDEASGAYWQLFVNGAASEVGIDGVELTEGSEIVWYYSVFGATLPQEALAEAA